jgi:hypothetical protein
LCTSMPIYLTLVIRAFLSGGVRTEHSKPYSKRGALLYCVGVLPDPLVMRAIAPPTPTNRSRRNPQKSAFELVRFGCCRSEFRHRKGIVCFPSSEPRGSTTCLRSCFLCFTAAHGPKIRKLSTPGRVSPHLAHLSAWLAVEARSHRRSSGAKLAKVVINIWSIPPRSGNDWMTAWYAWYVTKTAQAKRSCEPIWAKNV